MDFEGLLGRLSVDPRVRGREFERICAWYLQNAPEYHSQVAHVWLWDDWPGRWAADAGIDLVVETVAGDLWAIQAKAYDPDYAVKKSDVDSFLSESSRPQFSYRLLIATTDRVGATARRTLAAQEKPAGLLLRSQLAVAGVDWPSSPTALAPRRPAPRRPRPHQRKAVTAMVKGFRAAERGQLVMACGTGKTLAACFLAEKLRARRVLVLVPSLSLLAQTLREWASTAEFGYLAVCSDETIAGEDAVVASTSELGIPVTTDPAAITAFLRRRGQEMRVVFATYQSSPRIAEAQKTRTPAFDLVIADEAHRCAGPEAGVFATVLDAKKIKASKRLFMTATPRYYTGRIRKEAKEADWEIASMDDESRFGPVLHRLSFAAAIEQELLSDYQVAVVGVSDATYRDYAERGVFVTADGEAVTDARTLASQLGLLRAMANYDLHRIVSFHSRIRSASTFARSLPDVSAWLPAGRRPKGTLWAEHVSGQMTSGERDMRLNRLRAVDGKQRGVLSNARCLAEGVDVPTLDGVAFIEPRRSQIDIVQAVGRAIRTAEDKTVGTIVIPVFVDEEADPEHAIESGEFDRVWQVVKALRAHDDALAEQLDDLRRQLGRRGVTGRPAKIHLDLPVQVDSAFARAFDTRLVVGTTASWDEWYGLLETYVTREGTALVPTEHREDGRLLGNWVLAQRQRFQTKVLPPEQADQLAALSGWVWDAEDALWDEGFQRVERFAQRTGSARVPKLYVEPDGYRLGAWVGIQRASYSRGRDGYAAKARVRRRPLDPVRAARLEALPGWTWSPFSDSWERNFRALAAFAGREGHIRVPTRHREDNLNIGSWLGLQRAAAREGMLSDERLKRLEALPGWTVDPKVEAWETGLRALERYVERVGNAQVPPGHVEDSLNLGGWVRIRRQEGREGRLPVERRRRLEAVPGWTWSLNEAAWGLAYERLRRYAEQEGHASPPNKHRAPDGFLLARWVENQRSAFRAGKLDDAQVRQLQALKGWKWGPGAREPTGSGER
jgi:superfamily II DNA or RNA helicase